MNIVRFISKQFKNDLVVIRLGDVPDHIIYLVSGFSLGIVFAAISKNTSPETHCLIVPILLGIGYVLTNVIKWYCRK